MSIIEKIDVTVLEPRKKHPTIFDSFDKLSGGQSILILNDHDPKPLYYQLLGERGNIFTWEYIENGPDNWQVIIRKNGSDEAEETIGELVAADYRKAEVFKKFGIDFCCGGKKTLSEVCERKGLDRSEVIAELDGLPSGSLSSEKNYQEWPLDFLADYIVNTHHRYVRSAIPVLSGYLEKIAQVHGKYHPELFEINELFTETAGELSAHMEKEEQALFPYIKQMVLFTNKGLHTGSVSASVKDPVRMMEHEHDAAGAALTRIRELSDNYQLPVDACMTYRVAYQKLQEFESDLHQHIHLENNILFPKSILLEEKMYS